MRSPVALNVRVSDACLLLSRLLVKLEDELPEKRRLPYGGYGTGSGGHGPLAAWNTQAAMLILDIHAGARDLEVNLRYQVAGIVRSRGGSDGNTAKCLLNLPALCAGLDYAAVMIAVKRLEGWIWRARLILGDAEPFARLPRLPGESDPACPFCKSSTLRVRHATGMVICLRPACKDGNGNRPQGRIEVGSYSAEPILAWADGTTGVAAA